MRPSTDPIEEARRLVEEASGEWDAVEQSRALIEGAGYFPATLEEESELERARRGAPSTLSIVAAFLFAVAVILFCIYEVPA